MDMLKKLSVISEDYSLNVDVMGKEVATINLQSFVEGGKHNAVEIVATGEEIDEMISMLEHASDLLT